jgi:hypothetical protein
MHAGACIAINAKGGDCWQIFNRQMLVNGISTGRENGISTGRM